MFTYYVCLRKNVRSRANSSMLVIRHFDRKVDEAIQRIKGEFFIYDDSAAMKKLSVGEKRDFPDEVQQYRGTYFAIVKVRCFADEPSDEQKGTNLLGILRELALSGIQEHIAAKHVYFQNSEEKERSETNRHDNESTSKWSFSIINFSTSSRGGRPRRETRQVSDTAPLRFPLAHVRG